MTALPLLAALLLAAPNRAPSPEEQRFFEEGTRALEAGDPRAAAKAWQAGYAVGHDPAFLVHIGEAAEKAGTPAEALDAYRRYLREAPDASDRADIEQRIARLAPPAAAPSGTPPGAATAEPTGEFGGTPPPTGPAAPPTGAPGHPGVDTETPASRARANDGGWNRYNVTAFVAGGAAVLLLGTAGFFAASAASDAADLNRLFNYRGDTTGAPVQYSAVAAQYEKAMDDGPRHDRYAKAALIAAGGAAAVSVLFFVLDEKLGAEPAIAVAPAGPNLRSGAIASWRLRF